MQKLLESIKNLQKTSQNNRNNCDFFLQALKEWTLTEELYSKNMARISSHSGFKQECFGFLREYTDQASKKAKYLSEYLSANVIDYFKQLLNSQSNSLKSNFIDSQKILDYIQKKCEFVSESMTKYFSACRECEEITFDLDKELSNSKKEKIFQKMLSLKKDTDLLLTSYNNSLVKFNNSREKISRSLQKLVSSFNFYESQRSKFLEESLELIESTISEANIKITQSVSFEKSLVSPTLYDILSFEIPEISLETYDGSHPLFQNTGLAGFHFSVLETTGVSKGTQSAIEELFKNEIEEIVSKAWTGKELSSDDYVKFNTRLREPVGRKVWSWSMNLRRTRGEFKLTDSGFNQVGELMLAALNECERTGDTKIAKNCIILSQTFYKLLDVKKVFLQHFILNHTLWAKIEFWEKVVDDAIQEELKKGCNESDVGDEFTKHEKTLVFCQLVSFGNIMMSFRMGSKIENLAKRYAEKYEFSEDELKDIMASVHDSLQIE